MSDLEPLFGLNDAKTARVVLGHDESLPYHEWITTGRMAKANVNGVSNPRMYTADWVKVECNNPDCAAWAVVDPAWLIQTLHPALRFPTDQN